MEANNESDASSKVVVSTRLKAGEKIRLQKNASDLGITLSDYVESILVNQSASHLKAELEQLRKDYGELLERQKTKEEKHWIYSDSHLLRLFEKLRGKTDEITMPDGSKLTITYNTVDDLVRAIFYTIKI